MVLFNYSTKELTAKVVYYGAGLCGKTTNLQWIHEKLPIRNKGKMLSLATETDRTLFFDFLPIELGTIRGMRTRIQLYTVPGQVFYNATRRMVLKGADCVVFVCDSQEPMLDANLESFENLRENLEANEIDPDEIPMIVQYNKRDLPNALPIEILNERINPRNLPFFEAVAIRGTGVEETLKGVTGLVFRSLAAKYGTGADAQPLTLKAQTNPPAPSSPQLSPPIAAAPKPPAPPPAKPPAPPPAVSQRPSGAATTVPPVPAPAPKPREAKPDTEDILEAIDLGEPEGEEEELDLSENALALDLPPAEEAPPPPLNPKATLVSGQSEAESMRRRIAKPLTPMPEPELKLEDIGEELGEAEPPSPPPEPVEAAAVLVEEEPPSPGREATLGSPPEPTTTFSTAPVSVQLEAVQGKAEIAIPVEITLDRGNAQVNVHLHLTLNLKMKP
jgi:signal recognition particle receptor subunit beta